MRLTPEELTARKRRNLALAGALVAFIILVFVATVLNLRRNIAARQPGEIAPPAAVVPPGPAPATAQSPSPVPATTPAPTPAVS